MGDLIEFKPMKPVESVFDGWKEQIHGFWTDYKGGRDVLGWLQPFKKLPGVQESLREYTRFLAHKYKIPLDIEHKTGHSLLKIWNFNDFPDNILTYANDVLMLTPEDFRQTDLEFQFEREMKNDISGIV